VPILHFQINARRRTPEGAVVSVSPASALHEQGPLVRVSITLEENFAQTVVQSGLQLPGPLVGWGLIDTGASHTCIDEAAARRMGLPVIDVVGIASASEAEVQRNVYPIQVEVVGFPIRLQAPRAIGAELEGQGYIALLGRDVLQLCTIFYNGPAGEITLST